MTAEQAQRLAGVLDPEFVAPFLSKATFANGQLVGEWTLCDAQERPVFVWSFLAGKRHGLSTHFDSRGEVVQSIPYEHNVAHGAARLAAVGDNSPPEQQVLRGKMLRRADKWYPSVAGKQRVLKAQEWQLAPMALNPVAHDWNASSVEYQQPDEAETVRHGLSVTFFPNGQRESEGNYEQGKRSGTFAWWYSNGQQRTVGEYRNDAEHSEWTWWHENGMKQAVGMFAEGTRIDEWSVWNEEGKLVQRATPKPESQVAEREAPLAETQR
ncbi:MAG: hypothetical protein KDA45_11390 [Planctomycetales bacterium]|nr:hypothetical protein [Planctomycetales bacterium]